MTTRRVPVRQCDLCQKQTRVRTWTIGNSSMTKKVDLCPEHAAPLARIIESAEGRQELYRPVDSETLEQARQRRREMDL